MSNGLIAAGEENNIKKLFSLPLLKGREWWERRLNWSTKSDPFEILDFSYHLLVIRSIYTKDVIEGTVRPSFQRLALNGLK